MIDKEGLKRELAYYQQQDVGVCDFNSPEHFKEITQELVNLYSEKNKRYGGSFAKQVKEFGMLVAIIRLSDKMERLKYMYLHSNDDGDDESMKDTLKDLASYAVMSLMCLEERESGTVEKGKKENVSPREYLACD